MPHPYALYSPIEPNKVVDTLQYVHLYVLCIYALSDDTQGSNGTFHTMMVGCRVVGAHPLSIVSQRCATCSSYTKKINSFSHSPTEELGVLHQVLGLYGIASLCDSYTKKINSFSHSPTEEHGVLHQVLGLYGIASLCDLFLIYKKDQLLFAFANSQREHGVFFTNCQLYKLKCYSRG